MTMTATGTGDGGNCAAQVTADTQVSSKCSLLDTLIDSNTALCMEVRNRLDTVLKEPAPNCEKDAQSEEPLVPLAGELDGLATRVLVSNDILRDTLARLEL